MCPSVKTNLKKHITLNTLGRKSLLVLINLHSKTGDLEESDRVELLTLMNESTGAMETYDLLDSLLDSFKDEESLNEQNVDTIISYHNMAGHISDDQVDTLEQKMKTVESA